jgi:transcriptional regulator with XRE-family HTH domain
MEWYLVEMANEIDLSLASSDQLVRIVGKQVERVRLSRNITQEMLAKEAGVSSRTIRNLENGEGVFLDTFVRVLIALGLQENLMTMLPDPTIRPMERIGSDGFERKRARPMETADEEAPWSWGD